MDDNIIPSPSQERQPDTHEPEEVFTQLAVDVGLIRPGDKMDANLLELCYLVAGKCAEIADGYGDDDCGGNAGQHIRAVYFPA